MTFEAGKNEAFDETGVNYSPPEEELAVVVAGVDAFNESIVGPDHHEFLNIIQKNRRGEIIGGLLGGTYWGWLYIDRLWVRSEYRGSGLGRSLLKLAEVAARGRGCGHSHLDTMSFQAVDFYKKQGYEVKLETKDIPAGHSRFHMVKVLE